LVKKGDCLKEIGKGLSCSSEKEAIGELKYIKSIQDVISLFDKAQGKICLVEDAGTTTLGPIMSDLAGILCTTGGAGSHLAIVSREFDIPCTMAIKLKSKNLTHFDGKQVKIITQDNDQGILYLLD
jgi:phosphoenolpyruvate synthase/pyruvate phosphate dikinase